MLDWLMQVWRSGRRDETERTKLEGDFNVVRYRNHEAQDALKDVLLEMMHARLTPEDQAKVTADNTGDTR